MGDDDEDEEDGEEFGIVTTIRTPEWVEGLMALSGLSELSWKIEEERTKRNDEMYTNPYSEIEELVMSLYFEMFIGFFIVLNCIVIGWQASVAEGELTGAFNGIEHFFTAFFFTEWCLRILAFGWVWAFELVNFADSCLVFGTGVLLKWVAEPLGVDFGQFRIMTVLRALRLVRLARAVRLKPMFKEMWMLIHGLITSIRPLLWTLVIAFSVLYVFAIAGTELIGKSPDFVENDVAQLLFGDFFRSMFTMVQLITMDTYCDSVVRPLMYYKPFLAFFFILFITVGVFIVMNLVTAIIVDNAFKNRQDDHESRCKDEEERKRSDLKMLAELFMEIDLDGSGELSKEEFFGSLRNPKVQSMLDILEMKVIELTEIWEVLDDGDGLLTIKEFTDGIRRMKGDAKAKDCADVIKRLKVTERLHNQLQRQAENYRNTLKSLEVDAVEIAKDAQDMMSLFKEMYHRMSGYIAEGERQDQFRKRELDKMAKLVEGMVEPEESEEEEEKEVDPEVVPEDEDEDDEDDD